MSALPTTTPDTILASLKTQIEAITPKHTEYADRSWTMAEDFEVIGSDVRTFDLIAEPEVPDDEPEGGSIHGAGGIGYRFICNVLVSYGGLAPSKARRIAGQDGADLREIFENLFSTVSGCLGVPDDYAIEFDVQGEDEVRGTLVAIFTFTVRYKQADS